MTVLILVIYHRPHKELNGLDLADGLHNRQARWLVSGHKDDGLIIDSSIELSDDITVDLATIGGSVINKRRTTLRSKSLGIIMWQKAITLIG